MKWLNYFKYEQNGIVINFNEVKKTKEEENERYTFSVEGNIELSKKLLNSYKEDKVKKSGLPFCALELFKIVEGNDKKINISSTVTAKGSDEKRYYKIHLVHQQNLLSKNFTIYGPSTFGVFDDWEDVFFSNQQITYAEFLKEFGIKIPKELMEISLEPKYKLALDNFSKLFNFR